MPANGPRTDPRSAVRRKFFFRCHAHSPPTLDTRHQSESRYPESCATKTARTNGAKCVITCLRNLDNSQDFPATSRVRTFSQSRVGRPLPCSAPPSAKNVGPRALAQGLPPNVPLEFRSPTPTPKSGPPTTPTPRVKSQFPSMRRERAKNGAARPTGPGLGGYLPKILGGP